MAALGEWIGLAFAALYRRVPAAIGLGSVALLALLGALAWATYFNLLQLDAQVSQGRSLDGR